MPLLNLSNADTSGFEALPAGSYYADVVKVEAVETKGGDGAALPKGTPGINLQFKITGKVGEDEPQGEDSPYNNRRQFRKWYFPPAKGYDKTKADKMNGMIVRLLTALGYTEEEVKVDGFDLNPEDIVGRSCIITLKVKPKYGVDQDDPTIPEKEKFDNDVTGVRPAGALAASGGGLT